MINIKKFYNDIKNIKYGWHTKNGQLHEKLTEGNFSKEYKMQSIKDIEKTEHAICWEMCELQRMYFKKRRIKHKTIFAVLRKYNSLNEILDFFKNNFEDFTKGEYNKDDMEFYSYFKPPFRFNCNLFYFWCLHSKKLK